MNRVNFFDKFSYILLGAGLGILLSSLFINSPRSCSPTIRTSLQPPFTLDEVSPPGPKPDFAKYGYPGPVSDLRTRTGYISSYNRMLRNPNFSLEILTKGGLVNHGNSSRKHSQFRVDTGIPELYQAKLADYRRSGYDRGHMVPAADIKATQEAMDETFFLSNMAPQVGAGFNRDYWAWLEEFCRQLTKQFAEVYVITGPLYLPSQGDQFPDQTKWYVQYEVIGNPPNIAVPTHFFKAILAIPHTPHAKPALGAFLLPNRAIPKSVPLTQFKVPTAVVERASGLEFFQKLGPHKDTQLPDLCEVTTCQLH